MEHARVPTSEQLMAEMAWVRKLARALVKDAALADDVAQETWIVATERQPETDRPLRPWLARVVVNLVRTRRRSEARRDERDAAYDDGRAVPTPEELVEKVALQRAVADEVLALAEPYRATVLLHFVEGHTSAEIARRLGIPDGTVRRRLKVGLDQLREALRKRTDQPRRGWIAALVPFSRSSGPTASAAMGALSMKKVIGIVLLLVLLLIGGGLGWRHRAGHDAEGVTRAGGLVVRGSGARATITGADPGDAGFVPAWLAQSDVPARRIAGHVVANGAPVAGAKVVLALAVIGEPSSAIVLDGAEQVLQPVAETTSAADGSFDFGSRPAALFTVSASSPDHAASAVRVASANPGVQTDRLVVQLGDCRSRLTGVIADASGGAIAKARISLAGLGSTESDATGAYALCLSPRHAFGAPSALVRVDATGYASTKEDVIVAGNLRHDFLLVPEAVIAGRVITSRGESVAGARVIAAADLLDGIAHVASGYAMTDRDGRFRIAGLAPSTFHLSAAAAGLGTATSVTTTARPATTSRDVELVLTPMVRVRGQVMSSGAPMAGVTVVAVPEHHMPAAAISQADGSFVLDGVPPGTSRIFVSPHRVAAPSEIRVGVDGLDDVRIEVATLATVRGHVTRGGKPVPGADVLYMDPPQPWIVGSPRGGRTDATGQFELPGMPPGAARIVAWDWVTRAYGAKNVEVETDDTTVDIELEYAGQVNGTVVDEFGSALAGVYVRMDLVDGDDMCEAMTDASGQFACGMLSGGLYRPTIAPVPGGRQGFAPAAGDRFEPIRIPASGTISGVTLAVRNERLAIHGTVVDDAGAPVADVRVEALGRGLATMAPPSTMTDASGRFAIRDLARGTYQVRARMADSSESDPVDVEAGGAAASIVIAPR